MSELMKIFTAATLVCAMAGPASAADSDFVGDWMLVLKQGRNEPNALLTFESSGDGLVGHVEGGPIRLLIDGNRIEMAVDDHAATGEPYERYFKGTLKGGVMEGEFGPENPITEHQENVCKELPLACPFPRGTWRAERIVEAAGKEDLTPRPVDLTGRWGGAGGGLRKWSMDMTAKGQEWLDNYDAILDLPRQRCVSSGLVMSWGSAPEIYQSEGKITLILGSDVRRIYLDDRPAPESFNRYPMGYSRGHWEGRTLVIETTQILPSVRGFLGDPVSANARAVERFTVEDDGTITAVLTLHDPENYRTPPMERARWRRVEDTAVRFPTRCDPDSFYRQVYDDNKMQEYWDRGQDWRY